MKASAQVKALPAPSGDAAFHDDATHASVVFAGGCFWGVQGVFQHVKGVTSAVSGFTGGTGNTARYERVSDGDTGHAEAGDDEGRALEHLLHLEAGSSGKLRRRDLQDLRGLS